MKRQQRQLGTVTEIQEKRSRKIFLKGRETLIYKVEKEEYNVRREKDLDTGLYTGRTESSDLINTEIERRKEFPLKEVSIEKLTDLRKSGKPGFVLKENGKYYYAKIYKNLGLTSANLLNLDHQCAAKGLMCKHISLGCQKVLEGSSFIEKYDWITLGYETFNLIGAGECFVVLKCKNHEANLELD